MDNKTHQLSRSVAAHSHQCSGSLLSSALAAIYASPWPAKSMPPRAATAVRSLVSWMERANRAELGDLSLEDVREYYMARMQASTHPKSIRYGMRLAFRRLFESGLIKIDCEAVFALRVQTSHRLLPAMSAEDIVKVLRVIDRSTPRGKRNYACILIATALGLRCCDIVRIKLCDIDWRSGIISVVQSKTSTPIVLPLLTGIGDALRDYILNGRGKSASHNVFLKCDGEGTGITTECIQRAFLAYCREAGIPRVPGDGLGFHSLRRSVGKRLVTGGMPLPTVSQVLGHGSIASAERYINLSEGSLRRCALDFTLVGNGGSLWR